MAKNLILAISFGFKLNSNLNKLGKYPPRVYIKLPQHLQRGRGSLHVHSLVYKLEIKNACHISGDSNSNLVFLRECFSKSWQKLSILGGKRAPKTEDR